MKSQFFFVAGILAAPAHAQFIERTAPVGLESQFVPVSLDALANNQSAIAGPGPAVTLLNVPLDLARRGSSNNLFLDKAGWSEWEKDPLSFYAKYDETPKEPTDNLPVVQIPVDDYSAAYVLASCEADPKFSNVLTLRIGAKRGALQTTYHDFEFTIPRANEKTGANVVRTISTPNGNLFLLRLPLAGVWAQEFANRRVLDVEITKQLRLTLPLSDPGRFQYRPLGLPSGVHIHALTFERSPLRLSFKGTEGGNVFNEPQTPTFTYSWKPLGPNLPRDLVLKATTTDYYGHVRHYPDVKLDAKLQGNADYQLRLPVTRRGYYVLTVTLVDGGKPLLRKQTTFAVLPKDTRLHRDKSPLGTWDFSGTHFTPNEADLVGPLYIKAGLRYGMFQFSKAERDKYGVLPGNDPVLKADMAKLDALIAKVRESGESPSRWMLFHEDTLSGNHVTRTPDTFTGKAYKLNEAEEKRLAEMMEAIKIGVPKIRAAFPKAKIYLGNGVPHLMDEMLRHKLSPELFDVLGNEAAAFQRPPESQPTDFVANNPSMWMEHHLLDVYGYKGKGVEQSYEIGYPCTSPGNLTLRQQANYGVRNTMHSLAWGSPAIRMGCLSDAGNSYYHSNWGGSGLMFAQPNLSPKPLYVATATMTQLLDGAKFSRIVPTGSTTVYAFEFKKPQGGFVTCLWTPNASRLVTLEGSATTVVDVMYNVTPLQPKQGKATLTAMADPVFVESRSPIKISTGEATNVATSSDFSVLPATWTQDASRNIELESYDFVQPRLQGSYNVLPVEKFEGESHVLEIKPGKDDGQYWWLPRYTQLKPSAPIAVPGTPTHIGLRVNGNGGWGRIIFELEDAAGQRWISLGAEENGTPNPWLADWLSKEEFGKLNSAGVNGWNCGDAWGAGAINFSGWNTVKFPLPGNYPGEGYHWPHMAQWRCTKPDGSRGDYTVHYPLKVTKLAVTTRTKVLYGTEVIPVARPELYLKEIGVFQGDPDWAFWSPDAGQR